MSSVRTSHDAAVEAALPAATAGARLRSRLRLQAMREHYDFSGARVLDLGCGPGHFALQLAPAAASVLAVDGDAEKVEHGRAIAAQLGLTNIRFECATISAELVAGLGAHDVTLLLSVLHHVINDRGPYAWNDPVSGIDTAVELLGAIRSTSDALFFEMGNVEAMTGPPERWIPEHLLRPAGYQSITVIPPPAFRGAMGQVRRAIHRTLPGRIKAGHSRLSHALARAASYDLRDHRHLFLARP